MQRAWLDATIALSCLPTQIYLWGAKKERKERMVLWGKLQEKLKAVLDNSVWF